MASRSAPQVEERSPPTARRVHSLAGAPASLPARRVLGVATLFLALALVSVHPRPAPRCRPRPAAEARCWMGLPDALYRRRRAVSVRRHRRRCSMPMRPCLPRAQLAGAARRARGSPHGRRWWRTVALPLLAVVLLGAPRSRSRHQGLEQSCTAELPASCQATLRMRRPARRGRGESRPSACRTSCRAALRTKLASGARQASVAGAARAMAKCSRSTETARLMTAARPAPGDAPDQQAQPVQAEEGATVPALPCRSPSSATRRRRRKPPHGMLAGGTLHAPGHEARWRGASLAGTCFGACLAALGLDLLKKTRRPQDRHRRSIPTARSRATPARGRASDDFLYRGEITVVHRRVVHDVHWSSSRPHQGSARGRCGLSRETISHGNLGTISTALPLWREPIPNARTGDGHRDC